MYRRFAGLFLLGTLGALAFPLFSGSQSQGAGAIVQRFEARYQREGSLRAVFLERYSEGHRQIRVESGTVYFRRPGRMRWEYESPEPKLFLVDGKNVWFYVPADRTVTRTRMKESADWRTPLALLTGKARLSQLCERIELLGGPTTQPGNEILRCLPKGLSKSRTMHDPSGGLAALDPEADFLEVLLEVNPSTGDLAGVRIRQPGDIEMDFRFADWQWNPPLPDSFFRFQPPKGVAIVDGSSLTSAASPN